MKVFIEAASLAAPGMANWQQAQQVLRAEQPYKPEPLDRYKPMLLPPNERRRATEMVRLAFRICEDATAGHQHQLEKLASVFASSCGDFHIIDQVCKALSKPQRMVSPTQFHNSVHNSAAGYWSIATKSQATSTSLSAFDHSFTAGLIEACTLVASQKQHTLLAVYDTQPPQPLAAKRAITQAFATALLLSPEPNEKTLGQLSLSLSINNRCDSCCDNTEIEALRLTNPAARSLPLLELLAKSQAGELIFATTSKQKLSLDFQPWR